MFGVDAVADGVPEGLDRTMFTGDVVFAGSIRAHRPQRWQRPVDAAVIARCRSPPVGFDLAAVPGHGPATTMQRERATKSLSAGALVSRIAPISGFPEFSPAERLVEQRFLDVIRETFELHGFASIETRSVELISRLSAQGEDADKEIYAISRLAGGSRDKSRWGLHSDLTVPFARYVLENAGTLDFPVRRYQIQKAWRGERPQEGALPGVHPGRHRCRRRRHLGGAFQGGDAARHRGCVRALPGR